MKFAVIASGSAANAAFVSSGDTRLLIDDGLSVRELTKRMAEIRERPQDLTAIVVSHSHGDHVSGIGRLAKFAVSRGRAIPIYLQREIENEIDWHGLEKPPVKYFDSGKTFEVGGIQVATITTPHDCPGGGIAFTLADNHTKVGIATDLGFIPPAVCARFRSCQAILLESNYDEAMLDASDRPESLKERIRSRNGHLSNSAALDFIRSEMAETVQNLILGHRSLETNHPNLVRLPVMDALWTRGMIGQSKGLLLAEQDWVVNLGEIG